MNEVLNRDLTQKASLADSPIISLLCFYTIDVTICGRLRAMLCLGNQSTTSFAVSRHIPLVLVTGKIHASDMQSPPLGARPRAAPQLNWSDFFRDDSAQRNFFRDRRWPATNTNSFINVFSGISASDEYVSVKILCNYTFQRKIDNALANGRAVR